MLISPRFIMCSKAGVHLNEPSLYYDKCECVSSVTSVTHPQPKESLRLNEEGVYKM